jgi:hypothetical protein
MKDRSCRNGKVDEISRAEAREGSMILKIESQSSSLAP